MFTHTMVLTLALAVLVTTSQGENLSPEKLAERIRRLEATNGNLELETREQASAIKQLSSQLENLATSVTAVKQSVTEVKSCTESQVAFTVGLLSGSGQVFLEYNQIVKYNEEIYNPNNAYSPATGQFTCPVAGLYAFTVNAMSVEGGWCTSTNIRRNNDYVTFAYGKDMTFAVSASASVYLHLDVGDVVDVMTSHPSKYYAYNVPSNTFSGVLISADTCV